MERKGFTLIELLVVVAVIGLLATVILSSFTASRNKAKNSSLRQELSTVRTQAGVYFNAVGGYGSSSTNGLCSTAMASSSMFNAAMGNGADATARIMQRVGELAGDTALNQITKTLCYVQNDSYAVAVTLNGGEGVFCVDYRNITKFYPGGTGSLDLYAVRDTTATTSPQPFICRP